MCLKIQEGAIFIADAHESDKRDHFYQFLKLLESGEIDTKQLFLMGDMFDLLVGKVENCVLKYQAYIDLLEKLAQKMEIFYFEGNHDFCLQNLFFHVKVIPIKQQPMKFLFPNGEVCYVSHGDRYGNFLHTVFTKLIRSNALLSVLNLYDKYTNYALSSKIQQDLLDKNICSKIENFETIICQKVTKYYPLTCEYILEGHYHQNREFQIKKTKYINFSSFACNQSYFIVEFPHGAKFAQKKLRGCNV